MGSRARLLVWFSKGATATRRWTSRIGDVDCAGRRMRTIAAAPASITIPASTPATIRERRPGPLDGAVPSRGVVRPSSTCTISFAVARGMGAGTGGGAASASANRAAVANRSTAAFASALDTAASIAGENGLPQPPHRGHRIGESLRDHHLRARPRVERFPYEHLVQHTAETVDIAPPVDRPTPARLAERYLQSRLCAVR